MGNTIREPIQTYLTAEERSELDRAAEEMGVSRSEALRRGIRALRRPGRAAALRDLAEEGLVTPATAAPGEPPPSRPVGRLGEILAELAEDRADR